MAFGRDIRSIGFRGLGRGFGLIELVIVIAIVAILTVIALPSYQRAMQLNRVVTDTNSLLSAFNLARNEAVARGRPVTVCASVNGTTCDGTGIADWSGGYMVFTDYDPAGSVDAGAGDTVLRVFGPVAQLNSLKSINGNNVGYVSFTRTGTAKFPAAVSEAFFQIAATPCDPQFVRTISVTNLGRSASKTDVCP
jgi:type IV fimbrial biogenesis protein FimT